MKKLLALLLVLAMMLSVFAGCKQKPDEPSDPTNPAEGPTDPVEVDDGICETAQEFVDNMTVGWNLGCSLSAFSKTTIDGWGVMAYFLTPDGLYSRSEVFSFDPETKTAEITWKLGQDNGVMQVYEGAQIDGIGIELWNFSLSEADVLNYSIDELRYVTKDGEVTVTEGIGAMSTDMGGGTGGGIVVDLDEPEVADVLEIHAKVTYIEQLAGEPTPESIAAIELSWGNPLTTQEMIDAVRDRGFNMIRLQVSYVNHMDEEGNIDELWLDRVQEVVDYCMNAGVYCLLNTTGAGWMTADPDTFEEQSKIYRRLWEQIASRFADYGELLLFESCNEVLNAQNQWWNPPTECHDVMNQFYQIFVDTVRASGGYNETRNLVLNPYAATYSYEMTQYFKLPTDTVEDHLIAQVHCYEPNRFTMNETNLGHADFVDTWGTDEEKAALEEIMKSVKKRFIDELGIPVIIGEFGVVSRVAEEERAEYVGYYAHLADKYGIKLVIFDDGGDFTLFDRDLLIWPYPMIVDALFNKTTEGLGLDPNRPVAEDMPTVEAPQNPLEGWYAVAYFSGTDGTYNRSDFVSFDKETMTAEILWQLGKDNGVLAASGAAGIDCIGVDIWQQVSDGEDPAESIQYRIDEVKYYTAEGAVYITPAEAICSATMKDNGGVYAGGGQIANIDDPKVSDVKAIYLKVTFDAGSGTIGGAGESEGNKPVKEAIPSVSTPSNPLADWYVVSYFSGSDGSYNRSDMVLFDAETKTAEIIWKPGRDNGVLAAAGNATFGAIGLDFWNVPSDGEAQTSVTYQVKSVKYYTDEGAYYLYPTQSTYTASLRNNGMVNAGGGNIALVDNETVSNVKAIYVKVAMLESKGTEEPEEKPDDPAIGGVELPEVTARPENLHGWWMTAAYFIGTNDEGSWNRSGYSMFAAETQTAEILWKFGEGDALAATPDVIIENIGLQVFDGANKATNVAYTIEEVKYYTIKDNAYQETVLTPLADSYAADLTEESIYNTEIANVGGKTVEEIAAIYVKVKMLETETPDTPDVPDEPVETPDDLPTVTTPTNTLGYWYAASNFIGKDDGKWNRADYTPFDAETKTAEILWKLGENGVLDSGADMKIDSLGLQLIDGTGAAQNVEFTIKEIKFYTAVEGGYKEHVVEPAAASFAPALSSGTFTAEIATFDPALVVGDVAAIYVKVYFGVEEEKVILENLPTVTPTTSPMGYWYTAAYFIGKDDGKWNRSDYCQFDAETKTVEILWKFGAGGVLDSGADMKIDSLGLQLIDGTGAAQTAAFTVLEVKYYTAVEGGYEEHVIKLSQTAFELAVSSGTFTADIAEVDPALTVGDVVAVYVKARFSA